MYMCCLLPLRDILSYCYGAIQPVCAESAVKPQANKQTKTNIIIRVQVTGFVHNDSGGSQNLLRRVVEVRVFQHGQRYVRGTLYYGTLSVENMAACGLRGCKNGPTPFPGRMSYKATKPGLALCVVYLSMFYGIVVY